jgi:hypothetical protein
VGAGKPSIARNGVQLQELHLRRLVDAAEVDGSQGTLEARGLQVCQTRQALLQMEGINYDCANFLEFEEILVKFACTVKILEKRISTE